MSEDEHRSNSFSAVPSHCALCGSGEQTSEVVVLGLSVGLTEGDSVVGWAVGNFVVGSAVVGGKVGSAEGGNVGLDVGTSVAITSKEKTGFCEGALLGEVVSGTSFGHGKNWHMLNGFRATKEPSAQVKRSVAHPCGVPMLGLAVVGCCVVGKGVIAAVGAELGLDVVARIVGIEVGRGVFGASVCAKRLPGVLGVITGATVSCTPVSVQASKSYAWDSNCTPTLPNAMGFSALK